MTPLDTSLLALGSAGFGSLVTALLGAAGYGLIRRSHRHEELGRLAGEIMTLASRLGSAMLRVQHFGPGEGPERVDQVMDLMHEGIALAARAGQLGEQDVFDAATEFGRASSAALVAMPTPGIATALDDLNRAAAKVMVAVGIARLKWHPIRKRKFRRRSRAALAVAPAVAPGPVPQPGS
jgi:hypothetical protein